MTRDLIEQINARVGENLRATDRVLLGPRASWELHQDPRHLVFVLSRYKFVAKMLANRGRLLEIGAGDGLGSSIVAQAGNRIIGIDLEPVGLENAADTRWTREHMEFAVHDITKGPFVAADGQLADAAYHLDVIEHIPSDLEAAFMANTVKSIGPTGCLIVGTPNKAAEAYASKEAREQHINLHSQASLRQLMRWYFHNVFMFGMNDEVVHTGYSEMCHYIFALGVQKA